MENQWDTERQHKRRRLNQDFIDVPAIPAISHHFRSNHSVPLPSSNDEMLIIPARSPSPKENNHT